MIKIDRRFRVSCSDIRKANRKLYMPDLCKAQYFYKNNNEEIRMAEEKDNSKLYIGGIILIAIIGVMLLKQDEMKHLKMGASTESSQAAYDSANARRLATQNIFVE